MKTIIILLCLLTSLKIKSQDTIAVYGDKGLDRGINMIRSGEGFIATGITTNTITKEDGLVLFYDRNLALIKEKHFGGDALDFLWG